ncbi:MAG TPA: hypothetical protein VD860_09865 [Azospirillum sp.]|nr:hypothetical protein [Azospirillum sp.]
MKAIILLLFGLALLGGAAFGGWTLYNKFMTPPTAEELAKKEAEKPPPPVAYVRMNPIVVPVLGKEKVEQFVTIVATIEVDAAKQPQAAANLPRLIDAFIATMYAGVDDKSLMSGPLINIPAVKDKLTAAAAKVLGPGVVQGVLVQVVTQRNL